MDAVTSSTASAAATTNLSDVANPAAEGMISSDFETFLKLLTAQLKNQDPLNPLQSTDFAVQLATFSGVEQQVRTNDLIGQFTGQLGVWGMSQLAGWIGMEARAAVPAVFDGNAIRLETSPDPAAAKVELVVSDEDGLEVERFDITGQDSSLEWSGLNADGAPHLPGVYAFSVRNFDAAGDLISESVPDIFAPVTEARMVDGAPMLVLSGETLVSTAEVKAVRPTL